MPLGPPERPERGLSLRGLSEGLALHSGPSPLVTLSFKGKVVKRGADANSQLVEAA